VLTITYNNYPFDERLATDWGFSCVIEGLSKVILFDTGARGDILLRNMEILGFDPEKIDVIVFSHDHWDHTGGLSDFLKINHGVTLYIPHTFPAQFKKEVEQAGAAVAECDAPQKICDGVWTTGVLNSGIPEQGIYFKSRDGLVVVTGCAHPGIVNIVEAAKNHAQKKIHTVLGGFHMLKKAQQEIEHTINELKDLGVVKVAPSHCSGDTTRELMQKAFDTNYIPSGVGSRLEFKPEDRKKQ